MSGKPILSTLSEWTNELNNTLQTNNSLCIALFSADKKLIFANDSMSALFKTDPCVSFMNPTFDKLLLLNNSIPLIFEGYLTIGDYSSVNTSIWVQIYRKEDNLLVVGGVNTAQLLEQNEAMHNFNQEISNLQRELIREKHALENALEQLNKANNELKELNANKDLFISILAHDLKNPFNSILGYSDLLLKNLYKYDLETIEHQLKVISRTSHETYNLLEVLLLWSKSQSGKLTLQPTAIVFGDICNNIINNLKDQANAKDIKISFSQTNRTIVKVDVNMFMTILRNLISNAIKFTGKNGEINIYTERNEQYITVTVSDNGVGIKKENLLRLWDFTKTISTRGTSNEKGTGFGLLVCKEFVEKHGGQIWAESELGKGSEFKFTIPVN